MTEQFSRCRSCGADIIWLANDTTGRKAPIDATPSVDGPIVRTRPGAYRVLTAMERESDIALQDYPMRFTNHFQTCPFADRHKPAGKGDRRA